MGTDPLYDWGSFACSLVLVVVFSAIAFASAHEYHAHHDDRAAWSLLISLLKLVIAVGLAISSVGLILPHIGVDASGTEWALAGLSMVRGAMLVAGLAILLSRQRRE